MKNCAKMMNRLTMVLAALLVFAACSSASPAAGADESALSGNTGKAAEGSASSQSDDSVHSAVDFDHELDSYEPHKDHYNFYFTYKTVHSWWDAVALGMEEAQRQYLEKGITITYEYMAPEGASAEDQTQRLLMAQQKGYDVIGVDVADEKIISPLLDEMVASGTKVMTLSSSDAADGCKRLAYVGNTHNYQENWDTGGRLRSSWAALARPAMKTGPEAPETPSPNMVIWKSLPQSTIWIPSIWLAASPCRF